MWEIGISKQADKFTKKEKIENEKLLLLIRKFISYSKGANENIDVKRLKGKWERYHRIRFGKIRIILKIDLREKKIFVDTIDYRGDVYK